MTESTKIIFDKFQVRKTRKQKTAFIEWVREYVNQQGYELVIEKGNLGARNIVIGNPDEAKVVFTAHYDTCARMLFPNFITPKNLGFYIVYQLLISLAMMAFAVAVWAILNVLCPDFAVLGGLLTLYLLLYLMMAGPANKKTANDNTSGVTTVLDLLACLPEDKRQQVAFILFDFEEVGLIGSSSYASKHKKHIGNALYVNFDCVSDGDNMLFALNRKAKHYIPMIKKAFGSSDRYDIHIAAKGVFYPSDQMSVPFGVGVAALKKGKRTGVLYMDRIHTAKDTVYCAENIAFLCEGSLRLIDIIKAEDKSYKRNENP